MKYLFIFKYISIYIFDLVETGLTCWIQDFDKIIGNVKLEWNCECYSYFWFDIFCIFSKKFLLF